METNLTKVERTVIGRYMRALGKRGGSAAAARMTPKQRHARALKGSRAAAAARKARKEAAHA